MSPKSDIYPHLDRFQRMKKGRMTVLLSEIEEAGSMPVKQFLGSIAVEHGIRRTTAWEYIHDWTDAGYISVRNNIITYQKKIDKEDAQKEDTQPC